VVLEVLRVEEVVRKAKVVLEVELGVVMELLVEAEVRGLVMMAQGLVEVLVLEALRVPISVLVLFVIESPVLPSRSV
jgi:hypothetical protein